MKPVAGFAGVDYRGDGCFETGIHLHDHGSGLGVFGSGDTAWAVLNKKEKEDVVNDE